MTSTTLGDYTICKQIGHGALGQVYLAEHKYLKKSYALKVLPQELSSDKAFLNRFEKEVLSLATLEHDNIVKIHNVSSSDKGYFLVTDCIVDGIGETTNLSQYLLSHQTPLEEDEVYQIAKQVAAALDYAHGKKTDEGNFAHHGLKLNNVLIGKSQEGKMKISLSDFGLARIIGAGPLLTRTFYTVAQQLGMKLDDKKTDEPYINTSADPQHVSRLHQSFLQGYFFMAPEQKFMNKPISDKADIYSFGVLIYYLLLREYPEGWFTLPSKSRSDLKMDWDLLIYHCLQSDPQKRPSSLIQAMKTLLDPNSSTVGVFSELKSAQEVQAKKEKCPVINPQVIVRPQYEEDPAAAFQVDSTIAKYRPKQQEERKIEPLPTKMVIIPGGNYTRGSKEGARDAMPPHTIVLNDFAIDEHQVTNEQFVRFLEEMGGEKDGNNLNTIRLRDSRIKRTGGKLSIESGYVKHPVVGVTWYGAVAYAKWVGKRIPTEAEWEIASLGGHSHKHPYPTGDTVERSQANFFSSDTVPVKSYPPNGYELYDMAGNVYEWCQDWYDFHYYSISQQEPDNPQGPLQGVYRVLRGGCWKSLKDDMRCSHRHRNNPGTMTPTYGFRCAADVK